MSEQIKNKLAYEIAEELINKFDKEIAEEVMYIVNKHLYNYDVTNKSTSLVLYDDTTEKILKIFIGTKKLEGKAEGTLKQYYRYIRFLLTFLNCPIKEVTTEGIKLYLMTMKIEHNLQNSTIENMRCYIGAVFSWMFNEEYISKNPCAKISPIKVPEKIRESFSKDEMNTIKEYCKNNIKNFAIINFLYSTGARISEVCALNIEGIDFEKQQVIVTGKGQKQRKVYLTDEACEALLKYLNSRCDNNKALFLNNKNNRINPGGVRWILHNMETKTGINNIHPHRFRRTLATDLLNKGMPIQDVSKLLGHANVKVTQKYYYHTDQKVEIEFRKYME